MTRSGVAIGLVVAMSTGCKQSRDEALRLLCEAPRHEGDDPDPSTRAATSARWIEKHVKHPDVVALIKDGYHAEKLAAALREAGITSCMLVDRPPHRADSVVASPDLHVSASLVAAVRELCRIRRLPADQANTAAISWAERHREANLLYLRHVQGDRNATARLDKAVLAAGEDCNESPPE